MQVEKQTTRRCKNTTVPLYNASTPFLLRLHQCQYDDRKAERIDKIEMKSICGFVSKFFFFFFAFLSKPPPTTSTGSLGALSQYTAQQGVVFASVLVMYTDVPKGDGLEHKREGKE